MVRLTPAVRVALTALAAVIGVLASVSDSLPKSVQAVVSGAAVVLAGFGIIPPHVPVVTVAESNAASANN